MKSAKPALCVVPERAAALCRSSARAAAMLLSSESAAGIKRARRHVLRARLLARDANDLDRAFVSALYDWWRGRRAAARWRLAGLAADHPMDRRFATWAGYLAFTEGNVPVLLEIARAHAIACPDHAFAHALHAFALEQAGRSDEAMACAGRAFALGRSEPLALLVGAQLHEQRGDAGAGVMCLLRGRPGWDAGHGGWHGVLLATFARLQLKVGLASEALDVLDRDLLPAARTNARVLQQSIALLWRLEQHGVDAGDRWRELADIVEARWHEHVLPLLDLHFVLALAQDGRQQALRAFIASMERAGEADNTGLWQSVAIPVAYGLLRIADGCWAAADALLAPVVPRLALLGGSRQDREMILQAATLAATRSAARRHVSVRQPAGMQVAL